LTERPSRVLILPGLHNSGPEHWQSYWERENLGFRRVEQRDWETPDRHEWVETLERAIVRATAEGEEAGPVILVAHSLACCLVAHWAATHEGHGGHDGPIQGALLVGPSDVEAESYPPGTTGFAPMPRARLPFPSIVVASTDDFYISLPRAERFAGDWGARLEIVGALGHINSASGLGSWPQGLAFLRELQGQAKAELS
jgi:predicted alpha/beta hydrolase family esterase